MADDSIIPGFEGWSTSNPAFAWTKANKGESLNRTGGMLILQFTPGASLDPDHPV
jgi:hypothetical protein